MIFKKFKENNKFANAVTEFEISKTTMNFKINILKLKESCISLFYLKNNFWIIKNVCQEHASEFNNIFLANIFYYSKVNPF